MGCYYTLCHNTYAYFVLFYKVYIKRENAGSWSSGLEKEQILETCRGFVTADVLEKGLSRGAIATGYLKGVKADKGRKRVLY